MLYTSLFELNPFLFREILYTDRKIERMSDVKKFFTTLAFTCLVAFFVSGFACALFEDKIAMNTEWSGTFIVLTCSGMLIGLFGSLLSKNEIKQP